MPYYPSSEASKSKPNFKRQKSVDTLNELSWKSFEDITGEFFRQRGYRVEEMLGGGADGGVDLRLRKGAQLTLVQCKRWKKNKVGLPIIRELLGAMTAESADKGILVTTSTFTNEAVTFAQQQGIQLITGTQLSDEINAPHEKPSIKTKELIIEQTAPPSETKPPESNTPACPKCNSPMKLRTAKLGPNSGTQFWGCSTFPKCKEIINF